MSQDSGATAPLYILDLSVALAVARFDASVMTLIQGYDARGQSLVIPVLALTGFRTQGAARSPFAWLT